jgi:hypothetical protein
MSWFWEHQLRLLLRRIFTNQIEISADFQYEIWSKSVTNRADGRKDTISTIGFLRTWHKSAKRIKVFYSFRTLWTIKWWSLTVVELDLNSKCCSGIRHGRGPTRFVSIEDGPVNKENNSRRRDWGEQTDVQCSWRIVSMSLIESVGLILL